MVLVAFLRKNRRVFYSVACSRGQKDACIIGGLSVNRAELLNLKYWFHFSYFVLLKIFYGLIYFHA